VSKLNHLIVPGETITAASSAPIPPTPVRNASEGGISLNAVLAEMRDDERY
jgi:hypothetical protein